MADRRIPKLRSNQKERRSLSAVDEESSSPTFEHKAGEDEERETSLTQHPSRTGGVRYLSNDYKYF